MKNNENSLLGFVLKLIAVIGTLALLALTVYKLFDYLKSKKDSCVCCGDDDWLNDMDFDEIAEDEDTPEEKTGNETGNDGELSF